MGTQQVADHENSHQQINRKRNYLTVQLHKDVAMLTVH